jgi:hypothetical protein
MRSQPSDLKVKAVKRQKLNVALGPLNGRLDYTQGLHPLRLCGSIYILNHAGPFLRIAYNATAPDFASPNFKLWFDQHNQASLAR